MPIITFVLQTTPQYWHIILVIFIIKHLFMLRKTLPYFLLALAVLIAVLVVNTFRFSSKQTPVSEIAVPALPTNALAHFQRAIQFQTISNANPALFDTTQFLGFRQFLDSTYPLVRSKLSREIVEKYSLLYEWKGKNPSLKPIILMAHQDVVPIEKEAASMWTVDPFAGTIRDGFIWGRGTCDDKGMLIAILESVEKLLSQNFQPERTIYLSFGHNEEVLGSGAKAIAALLEQRNVKAEFILDEGGIITETKLSSMTEKPVGLVGTAEKGYISVQLTAIKSGGHSSMIEPETAIDMITKAVVSLRSNPFTADFALSTTDFFNHIGPEMPFGKRLVFANQWLFKPLIVSSMSKTGPTDAQIRTTTAPTIIQSGIKDNVVPTVAKAVVNFRILPGNTSKDVLQHIKDVIKNDSIKIEVISNVNEPSKVANVQSLGFQRITQSIKQNFGSNVIVSPYLVVGGTDSRYFERITDNTFRFTPFVDPFGFHGIDERVRVEDFRRGISFFEQLIKGF